MYGLINIVLELTCSKSNIVYYTEGKINIEHITIFHSKYISNSAIDKKFSLDVGNNPSNQNKWVLKLNYVW